MSSTRKREYQLDGLILGSVGEVTSSFRRLRELLNRVLHVLDLSDLFAAIYQAQADNFFKTIDLLSHRDGLNLQRVVGG